jgi:all-trans-retinol 13,14-reductase
MKKAVEGKDIVVIGSGVGGLSTGIILSLLGYDVTVVEKNSLPGGLMRSYIRSGVDCPVGVHYVGALGKDEPLGKMFDILGVSVEDLFERMGQDGVIDRYIFDDFTFDLPVGIDAYEANLMSSFPGDAVAIGLIMKNIREIARRMREPSFLLNQGDPFQNIDYFNPMGEYLQKLGVSRGLRDVLDVPSHSVIGVTPDDCPVIFHHMVLASYLFSSWRLKESGSKMAEIFAQRFAELGGKLILNDGANKILLKNAQVVGLRLQSGESLTADAVVAAIHPKVMLALLDPDSLKSSYRDRILNLEETQGVVAVQASVDAQAHPEMTYNIYRMQADEKGILNYGVFYQLRRGNIHGANLFSIMTKSLYSEWSQWENTQTGRRGRNYEDKKMNMARDLLTQACGVLGNFKNPEILDIFTPLTLRDYVNCPEGSCYGVMRKTSQLLKIASLNNIPLTGLYLAGQNAVAPGVLGSILGSFNAARRVAGAERFMRELNLHEQD